MIRTMFLFLSLLLAATTLAGSKPAQAQSPALNEALSRIKSGLSSTGLKLVDNAEHGRMVSTITYQAVSMEGCDIRIQTTQETDAYRHPFRTFTAVWTIPLGQLDPRKIRVEYGHGWSKTPTSQKGWKMGHFSLALPTLKQQKIISSIYTGSTYDKKGQVIPTWPLPSTNNLSSVWLVFKDKRAAQEMAAAFVGANRLCAP